MDSFDIVDEYLIKIKKLMREHELACLSKVEGATKEQILDLLEIYPQCPSSLIKLLSIINGTSHESTDNEEDSFFFLGSDVYEYPYFLKSIDQILDASESNRSIMEIYGETIVSSPGFLDNQINPNIPEGDWLCFSDCMNGGETSRLYIDFSPTEKGNFGQIIRYLHDPDEYAVIASNFDDYLEYLIEEGFNFMLSD